MTTLSDAELDTLAFQFFKTFARFEYALKTAGFHAGKGLKAEPNWDAFAKSINSFFDQEHQGDLGRAVHYIIDQPPRIQMVNTTGEFEWADEPETGPTARKLLLYIRRVRNNLFHGGKFDGHHWFAPDRSDLLMRHSLTVLQACLNASSAVKETYNN